MIKLEHTVLPSSNQMEFIIEGMRNPMNSWNRSDSHICNQDGSFCMDCINPGKSIGYCLGARDDNLMERLAKAGKDHRKFMRMIPIYVRITAPLYWWKEFDTYKVGTVANSCSTMHKIQEKKFTFDDFSHEHLSEGEYGNIELFKSIITCLNVARDWFIKTKDKEFWWQMIQLLPSSYNQTRNVMMNYEVLANIYHSRKNHKLDEWREFCKWIENLPYAELIIGEEVSEADNFDVRR